MITVTHLFVGKPRHNARVERINGAIAALGFFTFKVRGNILVEHFAKQMVLQQSPGSQKMYLGLLIFLSTVTDTECETKISK